ncbi:anhydro-N-acetylmuramic acid kinase [Mariprofundus erugo]|uniref:anhydro-N-acetylmuramic acid kinase n=1 Tax=Mariprofundus erugo TaxID=2528639 RepID=UPI0010FD38FE|nr:anhydro-N-acetylmuramic acid kinase [Mariprofundus erugo]TLS74035.1 anhydro-N-acetylmuramic acid kinase [Mariprofundus erugo]
MSQLMIGMMSGTSADGIDVAIIRCHDHPELLHFQEFPMDPALRQRILSLASGSDHNHSIDLMGEVHRQLGCAYAEAARATMVSAGLQPQAITAIGCHGQTIRHRPHSRHPFTLQIGCAATIAEQTGITTISDFRSRDIAAGGEGAPLVPFAHHLLFGSDSEDIAILNIGGIANVTWLGKNGDILGFDTGPGNMLMDGLIRHYSHGQQSFDHQGELAATGHVCQQLLETLISHPYLKRQPPKSTGREEFGEPIVDAIINWPALTAADALATACQFTVQSIADSINLLPASPARWLICGGGARNHTLMQQLAAALAPAVVQTTAAAGLPPQAIEAASFAVLARQSLLGAANTVAAVTGARHNVCGGSITPGLNWPTLLQEIINWTR